MQKSQDLERRQSESRQSRECGRKNANSHSGAAKNGAKLIHKRRDRYNFYDFNIVRHAVRLFYRMKHELARAQGGLRRSAGEREQSREEFVKFMLNEDRKK